MVRKLSRRELLFMGTGALAHLVRGRTLSAARPEKRRLLFNCDGSMIHCWGRAALPQNTGPLTREEFTSLVFTPIENAGADALLFSFGSGNVAEYQSNVLEWPGEADDFRFPESKTWHGGIEINPEDQYRNPKSLAEAGNNPPKIIVEECRKRGMAAFVSLRMNDIHDGQHPKGTFPNPELPSFKRINPDWLVPDLDWWSALNFEVPQVRELKLKVIEEFFDRWDFDGIELDWLRHTLYFPRGMERQNGKYLTEFMRTVRDILRRKAARRGRPIEIGVRIPERLEWCLEGGFEVPAWIEEDLIDFLILGQGLTECPDLLEFKGIMNQKGLPIYPCLYSFGNGYQLHPDEVIRGNAANLWRDGADGIYTFNWFFYGRWRERLLREIANPDLLMGKDKQYVLMHRFESQRTSLGPRSDTVRFNSMIKAAPLPLRLAAAGTVKTISIPVSDKLSSKEQPRSVDLLLGVDGLEGDILEIFFNDQPLKPRAIDVTRQLQWVECHLDIPPLEGILGFPSQERLDMTFRALRLNVPVKLLLRGQNKVSVRLRKRSVDAERPLIVRRVELSIRYS